MAIQQKIPLSDSLNQLAIRAVREAMEQRGKALPCSVVSQAGSVVTVKFEVSAAPFTLPQITIPVATSQYVIFPTPAGTKGVCFPADGYIGNVTGLGSSTPGDFTQRANLSQLVFFPVGNANWTAQDATASVITDVSGQTKVTASSSGLTQAAQGPVTTTSQAAVNSTAPTVNLQSTAGASLLLSASAAALSFAGHSLSIGASGITADGQPLPTPALNIANNEVLANISGATAPAIGQPISAVFDATLGSQRGELIFRGQSNWGVQPLGPNGSFLGSNGIDLGWRNILYSNLPNIANLEILSNISGVAATPTQNTLTQIMDASFGSARGDIAYRGASSWAALVLGTNGQVLTSNGTDILWGNISASSLAPIPDATLLSNISGAAASPSANSLTNIIDHDMGASRGEILYRGVANWAALALGSNGQALVSNGTDILWGSPALSPIVDATILSNISGGTAAPVANTLTAVLDHDMGAIRGEIIYRGASNWAALGLGSTGQMLRSNGTDITWASSIGYSGDQSYQTANWAPGTNFSTNCSFYTSATTQQAAEREILAGVFLISTLGGNQAASPQRDKVALSGMIEGQAGSGDTWALYGVNIIDAGSMASTGYTAHTVELDLNNRSTVDLSNPITIGGHTAQAFGASITGSSLKPCTAGLWITGTGAAGGPGNAQWDKGIWFTGGSSIGTACIVDASQNAFYCLDVSGAVYQKAPINWNTGATATTATAGTATLPANPAGFLLLYNGGSPIKVPYYLN